MRRLDAQGRVLARDPPADWFLAVYFRANDWWTPPNARRAPPVVAPEINSTLPEYEP